MQIGGYDVCIHAALGAANRKEEVGHGSGHAHRLDFFDRGCRSVLGGRVHRENFRRVYTKSVAVVNAHGTSDDDTCNAGDAVVDNHRVHVRLRIDRAEILDTSRTAKIFSVKAAAERVVLFRTACASWRWFEGNQRLFFYSGFGILESARIGNWQLSPHLSSRHPLPRGEGRVRAGCVHFI